MTKRIWLALVILLVGTVMLSAQEDDESTAVIDCPALVDNAIELTATSCNTTLRNEACYGNILLDASPRDAAAEFNFAEPGDIVELLQIESLQLSAMDLINGQWGVVLLELAANLSNGAVSPEDVQLVLFGDSQLQDRNRFASIITTAPTNIRTLPGNNGIILSSLEENTNQVANGISEDGEWLRIRFSDEANGLGWISRDFVSSNVDLDERLRVITDEEVLEGVSDVSASFGPLQAFYFGSNRDDAPCEEAPNSGMLVQTPEGVAEVTLWLDEVVVQLDGTAFVQADAGGELTLNLLSGSAQVTANGEQRGILAGQAIDVPIDEDFRASDVPGDPRPINPDDIQSLPINLLNETVDIATPLILPDGIPLAGTYAYNFGVDSLTCEDGVQVPFLSTGAVSNLNVGAESISYAGITYQQQSEGIYTATYQDANLSIHQDTLQVVASDRIVGEKRLQLGNSLCELLVPFSLQLLP